MSPKVLFQKMTGVWEGTCRTWFEPGKLADESKVTGEISKVLDGRFLRHTYAGTIQGKPRRGEEMIGFNSITKTFQSSWVDDLQNAASDCAANTMLARTKRNGVGERSSN